MTDVSIATDDDSITAALEVPAGAGPWPGVVIVHDAFGLGRDHRDITRRVADHGYLALSPDLYARGGRAKCVRTVFGDLMRRRGRTVGDIVAARDHLAGHEDAPASCGRRFLPRGWVRADRGAAAASTPPRRSTPR